MERKINHSSVRVMTQSLFLMVRNCLETMLSVPEDWTGQLLL